MQGVAMSKTKSNVHPAHYKVAGRERQGEDVVHDREKSRKARLAKPARAGGGSARRTSAKSSRAASAALKREGEADRS
jgi:hypothetical protein